MENTIKIKNAGSLSEAINALKQRIEQREEDIQARLKKIPLSLGLSAVTKAGPVLLNAGILKSAVSGILSLFKSGITKKQIAGRIIKQVAAVGLFTALKKGISILDPKK